MLRTSGAVAVLTPDQLVQLIETERARSEGKLRVILQPLMGGMARSLGDECLELVHRKVMPRLR